MNELFGNVFFWIFGLPMFIGLVSVILSYFQSMGKMRLKMLEMQAQIDRKAEGAVLGWVDREEFQQLERRVAELENRVAGGRVSVQTHEPRSLDPILEAPDQDVERA